MHYIVYVVYIPYIKYCIYVMRYIVYMLCDALFQYKQATNQCYISVPYSICNM